MSADCAFSLYLSLIYLLVLYSRPRFHTDPSGTFTKYEAKAIGSGSEAAQGELQDKWHSASPNLLLHYHVVSGSSLLITYLNQPITLQRMTLVEAQKLALKILKQVMEEKLDQHNVQLAQVRAAIHSFFMPCSRYMTVLLVF